MEKLLTSFTVASPVFPNDSMVLRHVKKSDSAPHALEMLVKHGLTSIPIIDDVHGEPVGMFGVNHVVAYVCKHIDPHATSVPRSVDWDHWFLADAKFKAFTTLDFVHYVSTHYHIPPAIAMPTDISLLGACKILVEKHAHEIIVYNKEHGNRLENLIAASRVVQFLSAAVEDLPGAKQPIGDFEGGLATKKPLVAVFEDAKILSAFEQMSEKKVTCCAVLNGEHKLAGNVSLSDIKAVGADFSFLHLLGDSVTEYLKAVDDSRGHRASRTPRPKVVTCSALDPLRDVLDLFAFYKVHHVYIVDAEDKPIGVISTLDVLRWILIELKAQDKDNATSATTAHAHHHHQHHHEAAPAPEKK